MSARRSLVPASVSARIKGTLKPNAFETQMALGHVEQVTFHRDNPTTGADVAFGPVEMLIKLPGIGGAPVAGGPAGTSVSFVGFQGELRARNPLSLDDPTLKLKVHREDRFCLSNGTCGRVLSEPMDETAFTRVPFIVER